MNAQLTENSLRETADAAYACCVRWFGPPTDPETKYDIFFGPHSLCVFSGWIRRYLIQIYPSSSIAEVTRSIGHEMCHRVTTKRKGLHKEVWVSEMLAFLAEQWFLHDCSLGEHADSLVQTLFDYEDRVPISQLKSTKRNTGIIARLHGNFYPPDFRQHTARLGTALAQIVGRELMAQMVEARDLQDWIAKLPPYHGAIVSRVLGEPDLRAFPADASHLRCYGYACTLLGDVERAALSYRQALALCPSDGNAKRGLEYALERLLELP
jgi:hypothetical protein